MAGAPGTNETLAGIKLPLNAEVEYFPGFLSTGESAEIFEYLCGNYNVTERRIATLSGEVVQKDAGKFIFADPELTEYDFLPEVLGQRAAWPPPLAMVKERLETLLSREFNVCLCIHYRSGEAGAGFHMDMPEFGPVSFITVISLGAEREIAFRAQDDHDDEYRHLLQNGSLLTMGQHCQERYEHGIPYDPSCTSPRISLSYRPFGQP